MRAVLAIMALDAQIPVRWEATRGPDQLAHLGHGVRDQDALDAGHAGNLHLSMM